MTSRDVYFFGNACAFSSRKAVSVPSSVIGGLGAPWRPAILSRSKKRKCPWMTSQLLHLLQKQKAMSRRVIRSGRRDTVAVQQHRALRNQYNNLYRQNKNMYFQQHLAEYRYAPRPLWKEINHMTGRQQQRLPPSVPLSELKSYFESLYSTPVSRQLAILEGPPNNFSRASAISTGNCEKSEGVTYENERKEGSWT